MFCCLAIFSQSQTDGPEGWPFSSYTKGGDTLYPTKRVSLGCAEREEAKRNVVRSKKYSFFISGESKYV